MQDKSKNIILLELVILVTLVMLFGIGQNNKGKTTNQDKNASESEQISTETMTQNLGDLTVTFYNVGKADCMLIETTAGAIMIDTGYDENGEDIVSWLTEKGIDSLEYLILTHPDKDHIGGADIIINNMNVSHIIDTDCVVNTKDYVQYKQAAEDKGSDIVTLTETKEIILGEVQFTLYPPISKQFKGQNDYSIVTKLVYGEIDFLFAGDAEEDRIDEIMSQIPDLASTVLKVPHHGTLMKNSEEFFEAVAPRYSIISSDKKEVYQGVVSLLQDLNSEVFSTKDGNIIVKTDGKEISIRQ